MERLKQRGKLTATFMTMLLLLTFSITLLPEVTASPNPVTIDSITPIEGHVGETVRVLGEIDTLNGSYTIFFSGDEVKNGVAVGAAINDTFIVPHRPLGNYSVMLQDVTTKNNYTFPTSFAVETAYYLKAVTPQLPQQLQEGEPVQLLVNVTGGEADVVYSANITVTNPAGAVHYNDLLQLTNTTNTGYSEGNLTYPENFSPGANTNYVGVYIIAFNETLATGNFTVGLTDRLQYRKRETVSIRGSGYGADENVTLNITASGISVEGYPKNVTANADGLVVDVWLIPENVTAGTHTVTLTNATTPGTVKNPADTQNFTVLGAICLIQAWNVAIPPEPLASMTIVARNVTTNAILDVRDTNETGWAEFSVDLGNYTFEAEWEVDGNLMIIGHLRNQSFTEIKTYKLNLTAWVANLKITIHDEAGNPLPFIDVSLNYTYTTEANRKISQKDTLETNTVGIATLRNAFANISYGIEARRYGHLFNTTQIANLTVTRWINITCPTYTMFVHVRDSKNLPIQNVDVDVIEWSSGILVDRKTTNTLGSVPFSFTFGRYKVRVYNGSALQESTVVLNETITDLIEDQFFVVINCRIFNIDLSLSIIDYFGQPVPNTVIAVERDGVEFASLTTGRDGTTTLHGIIGGDCSFSVYILGKLSGRRTLYLDGDKGIVFKIDRYIIVGGYPLEIAQFIAFVSLTIVVAIFALALAYRRISKTRVKNREESSAQNE